VIARRKTFGMFFMVAGEGAGKVKRWGKSPPRGIMFAGMANPRGAIPNRSEGGPARQNPRVWCWSRIASASLEE